jgi:two-component system, NtrC family, sensor kinase
MQYVLFVILAPVSALTLIATAIIISRNPRSQLSANLQALMLVSIFYVITDTLELIVPVETGTMFYARLGYSFSQFAPAYALFFTLAFTGNEGWLTARNKVLTLLIPVLAGLLVCTEPLHGLIWSRISFVQVEGMLAMNVDHGWAHWIGFAYAIALYAVSLALLLRETLRAQPVNRCQGVLALAGIGIPLAMLAARGIGLIPGLAKDYAPIAYAAGGLCLVASARQHRLIDLIPIARSILIDDIADSMIVVDAGGRIVDINRAAHGLLGRSETVIGANIGDHPELKKILGDAAGQVRTGELSFLAGGTLRYFDARVSRINGGGNVSMGSIILLHDVTDTHSYLEERNRLIDELTKAAKEIKTLEGIIPICMYCKKIRDDTGFWHHVEQFVSDHSNAQFSHGMCPECQRKLVENGYRMQP